MTDLVRDVPERAPAQSAQPREGGGGAPDAPPPAGPLSADLPVVQARQAAADDEGAALTPRAASGPLAVPAGGLDIPARRQHEDLQRSLGPQQELQRALRQHQELQQIIDQKNALSRGAAEITRAIADNEASGIQAAIRGIAASARQHRELIESMALSTAMQHSLAQMQKTIDADAGHRRLFEHQTAFLTEGAFAQTLGVLAKQSLGFTVDPVMGGFNVPAQLSVAFAQQRQRGFDTLAVFNALHARPAVSASMAATLAGLALGDVPQERAATVEALKHIVGEEIIRRQTTAPTEPNEEVDNWLATLVAAIWARMAEGLQGLSLADRLALLNLIVPSLMAAGALLMTWQQGVQGSLDHAEEVRAIHGVESAVRAQTEVVSLQQRFIATQAKPLRANPAGSAERVVTIPKGATVVLRYRVDRWLFVSVVDGDAAGIEGWVFVRDLRPVTMYPGTAGVVSTPTSGNDRAR